MGAKTPNTDAAVFGTVNGATVVNPLWHRTASMVVDVTIETHVCPFRLLQPNPLPNC